MRKLLIGALLCPFLSMCQPLSLRGKIINQNGEPIPGATVTVISPTTNHKPPTTNAGNDGTFSLTTLNLGDTVSVTAIGYEPYKEVFDEALARHPQLTITLKTRTGLLDEAVIIAYGKTTRRLSTGNVARLSAGEIAYQPVSNPLSALEGHIPGLTVVQSSGLPGASVKLQLRGQSSITAGSDPLFIVDGVPWAAANNFVNRLSSLLSSGGGGLSPFNTLSPADIESIEILKDADATAIYGSRGAAGVVLITTKKGTAASPVAAVTASYGFSKVSRQARFLNTAEYLQMRREAFRNDGVTPTLTNAPDLLAWDTTRYTNWPRLLTGGTARTADVQASLSGGTRFTRFYLGSTFHRETTVFPGNMADTKGSLHATLSQASADSRFNLSLSLSYSLDKNNLAALGLAGFINLPPNAPYPLAADGSLVWEEGGAAFNNNPFAWQRRSYAAKTDNGTASLNLSYNIFKGLVLRTALGGNFLTTEEEALTPIAAQNPSTSPRGTAQFATNRFWSWIAEPQLSYTAAIGKGRIEALLGASVQQSANNGLSITGSGYTTDALLRSLAAAPTISSRSNGQTEYNYAAGFGRLTYNLLNRYIINFSGRRDGSSRFGPGRQWASFGAVGGAWIFSSERWPATHLPVLSFGKLRASWGTTGNDQIGDYQYLDAWGAVQPYGGNTALTPSALFNPSYSWEVVKKWEAALNLGFCKNRFLLSVAWFRNRSGNQLVKYSLPVQTGFSSITDNFPALVQNTGWEVELSATPVSGAGLTWTTTANLTVPQNKLLSFPGLAKSSYASTYIEGRPLSVIYKLRSTGVDPATGVFTFEDKDKSGTISIPADYLESGYLGPRFYGGWGNTLTAGGWEAYLFFSFKKQWGATYLSSIYAAGIVPGSANNQPIYVQDRWQAPGNQTTVQRFTAVTSGPAYAAVSRFRSSDGLYGDASFIRLKTASLAYNIPANRLKRWGIRGLRLYLQGQNLLTFTGYKGADPENQNLLTLPPLKTLVAGLTFTF
ncbi:SusC/RagA family TonB-linked outer membrane protein [Flavisolibacter ginsenosidimutans]|nr:SusC/RagA family TonB-linked outer membrane protein [Flavisolibacter ginsenosidimutans]